MGDWKPVEGQLDESGGIEDLLESLHLIGPHPRAIMRSQVLLTYLFGFIKEREPERYKAI